MAKTIEQIQAMITQKGDAREVINEIADYLQANPGGGSSYLVYTANILQSGTSNPTAQEFANTVGGAGWIRDDVGLYGNLTTTNYDGTKIYCQLISSKQDGGGNGTRCPVYVGINIVGYIKISLYDEAGKLWIYLNTYDDAGAAIELSDLIALMQGAPLSFPEIRVYP